MKAYYTFADTHREVERDQFFRPSVECVVGAMRLIETLVSMLREPRPTGELQAAMFRAAVNQREIGLMTALSEVNPLHGAWLWKSQCYEIIEHVNQRWEGWDKTVVDITTDLTRYVLLWHKKRPNDPLPATIADKIITAARGIIDVAKQTHEERCKSLKTGSKVRIGGKRGHEIAHGDDDEKQNRQRAIVEAFDAIYPAKVAKKTVAYQQVAKQFGVSTKTVQRALEKTSGQSS